MLTQEEYRTNDHAEQCPQCQSYDYEILHTDVAGAQVVQDRACLDCGLEWAAIFKIAGYVRKGHEEEDFDTLFTVACVETTTHNREGA